MLTAKYTVKRLGRPIEFLGWPVTYPSDGSTHRSQPALVNYKITNDRITAALGPQTRYPYERQLNPPTPVDTPLPTVAETLRKLVRDLWYLADSSSTDLSYVTAKLGTAVNQTTTRHWHAMKSTIRYLIQAENTGIVF